MSNQITIAAIRMMINERKREKNRIVQLIAESADQQEAADTWMRNNSPITT